MTASRLDRQTQQGFTLIEMMVVLLVVAMAAAIAMPMLGKQAKRPDAHDVADELQLLLFGARMRAIARGSTETIVFDVENWRVSDPQGRHSVELAAELHPQLLIGRELTTAGNGAKLLFFPDGGSSGAKIALVARQPPNVSVIVPWLTGVPMVVRE